MAEMLAAHVAVDPEERDMWARDLARASSLVARAAGVVVSRVLVVWTECAELWNIAVPVVPRRRKSLSIHDEVPARELVQGI
jgi:hypothetical protein